MLNIFFAKKSAYTLFWPVNYPAPYKENLMLIQTLQSQFGTSFGFLRQNLEGFDAASSLLTPSSGGNSAVWLVRHITAARQMPLVFGGQHPLWSQEDLGRWARSAAPLQAGEAGDWNQLRTDLDQSQERLMGLLAGLKVSELERETPAGPLGSVVAFLATHEAYHVGQLAMLRRALGMPGMLK